MKKLICLTMLLSCIVPESLIMAILWFVMFLGILDYLSRKIDAENTK